MKRSSSLVTGFKSRLMAGAIAGLLLGLGWSQPLQAQGVAQATAPIDPEARLVTQALTRQAQAELPATHLAEGEQLYARDVVKLDGYAYCGLALSLAEQGDFRQSIRAASKALYLGVRDKQVALVAVAHRDLALTYLYAGKLDEAESYARSAQAQTGASPEQVLAPTHKILGDVAARRGQPAQAIAAYQAALAVASPRFKPLVQVSLANALTAAKQPDQALQQLDAVGAEARAEQGSFYLRSRASALLAAGQAEAALAVYDQIAKEDRSPDADYQRLWAIVGVGRVHLSRQQPREALQAFMQATTLANGLAARFRSEEFRNGLFGDMQAVYDQALRLAVQQQDFASAWALSEAARSRQLLDAVRDRAADSLGGLMSLKALQAQLRPEEGVLEFHALPDQLVIWTIRRDGFKGVSLPMQPEALNKAVEAFRSAIINRRPEVVAQGQALYAQLIAPAEIGGIKRLFVVPHGPLHYLPFQALHDGQGHLIARTALAVWPSASVGAQLWARPQQGINALLAFGNPATQENVPLPGAEREVNQVAELFQRRQVFLQQDATKQTFKQRANQSAVLHVAAHAKVDDTDPLFSSILLAREGNDRGLLEAREVFNLNMRGVSLVTLSACESGLGKVLKGDEIVGFTRSFLSAGASSLVASLWPVADNATEALMTRLYQAMTEGRDLMDAMQAAQLDVQRRRGFTHPFFWAPFNVIGNGRMALAPMGS